VTALVDTLDSDDYDEFALLHENAAEWNIQFVPPVVRRNRFQLPSDEGLSYIRWGLGEPELIFLHGGAQNAHTWDSVLLALDVSAVALDLPGHGHSDRRADRNYGPWQNADTVAPLLESVAPRARCVIGMSLGGATAIRLVAQRPDLCRRAVLVDVTPQINDPARHLTTAERGTVSLIEQPPTYDSFEDMADAAVALSPLRAPSGVRRGVRHNARRLRDGRWTWRYDLFGSPTSRDAAGDDRRDNPNNWIDFTPLWNDVNSITVPTLLVRGALSPFVWDEDVAEMQRRLPALRFVAVDGAGHAVQSDRPLVLAELIRDFAL
jgi:pimeloyl-ACP methyl ester carboxylesterase